MQKRFFIALLTLMLVQTKSVMKGVIEFTAPSCCDPIIRKITFPDKFADIPQILVTIRAIEYDAGPVGFFCQIQDVTEQDFTFQLTVLHATLKVLAYDYIAINQDEVEFGYFNVDALSMLKKAEAGDRVIPSLLTFKRTFTEDPIVQVFLVGVESQSKLIQFEVSPLTVSLHGVQLNFKKFGETSVQKVQLAYVATQSSKELAQQVTHTGQKQAHIEPVDHNEESHSSEKAEETKEFLQLRSKPKLIQINGINGLRFTSLPVTFMWQGDQIDPTALNVNLRITLDKGNQAVLGLYYFEEKEYKKCPIVYSMCNYQGSKVYLCKDVSDFNSIMRLAKSIYIPEKTSVVVYQDPSYSGAKSKITKSIPCISDWFTDVAETEMSDIKQFLQINQMKRHKDQEFKEIHLDNQKQLNKFNMVQLPRWNEAGDKIEVVQAILDSNSPPANSYKQELIQKLNEEEESFLKKRQIY
ncbi:unnamed protein product [Paramecium octaurelia]|uniref:H-type lectin domain-containing protein n=1 Tax=Paramecium octaurelia TaxID=43137 RepID=A0A8S1U507_PAROT|nr:unnamed protein product [Paramecium octaurelia]